MSSKVFFLLNDLRVSLFLHRVYNKFHNTGARMLDAIHNKTLKLIKNAFWRENVKILQWILLHGILSLPDAT